MRRSAPSPVYQPTSVYDWTGFYIGGQVGYQWGSATAPYQSPAGSGAYNGHQAAANQSGAVGGLDAAYQYQFNSMVLGIAGDIEFSGVSGSDGGSGGDVNALDNNWQGSIRANLGYAFNRFLVYGTGGVAFMSATATAPHETDSVDFTGWTAGGGVAYAFTNHWSTAVEYRYTDFGTSIAHFPKNNYNEKYNPIDNAVRVILNYRF